MFIRKAEKRDLPEIIRLMREFAEFEDFLAYFETTEERMAQAMFSEDAFVEGLVVEIDRQIVAYAIFYQNFATFRGQRGMYLEDLYITSEHRRTGIGEALLHEIAAIAADRGCERIDFQVLEWNSSAIAFYEGLGAERDDIERHFKFTDRAFERLAQR